MRQLLPHDGDVDPLTSYLAAERPATASRPWVAAGMITALDGGAVSDGRSGGLGGPADSEVLRAVRGIADAVLVGAGTVQAEDYGPLRHADDVRAARRDAGRSAAAPRLVIVSGSLSIGPDHGVFDDPPVPPLVCTTERADDERAAALGDVAEVFRAGVDDVDLAAVLERLASDGAAVVVSEGGPTLNGALVDAGLVDEWCLTISPLIVGGDGGRIVAGAGERLDDHELRSLLTADGMLFGRWVRSSDDQTRSQDR